MWPVAADDVDPTLQSSGLPPLKRRASEHNKSNGAGRNIPTAFFFRTEDELEQNSSGSSPSGVESSTFGVQSLASNVSSTHDSSSSIVDYTSQEPEKESGEANDHSNIDYASDPSSATVLQDAPLHRTTSAPSNGSSPSRPLPRDVSITALSGRDTPLHLYSPAGGTESGPGSTPKSVSIRSLQLSEDGSGGDDAASQAIASGDEDEDEPAAIPAESPQGAPQLVMPNLRLPSRRPFTQRGKEIGKLKIMVAGGRGVGKTCLIKSIVQACEDIVHVDPLTSTSQIMNASDRRSSTHPQNSIGTDRITEISASTRAYPSWWSELGESRLLRRRQSVGEQVLERNICFVDTPGFDPSNPSRQTINTIIEHVEASLRRNLSFASLSDGEVLSILSGSGGVQVDLVLYIFQQEPTAYDLDLIRRLSDFVLVVPVVSKADLLSEEELTRLSSSIANELRSADITFTDLENSVPGSQSWSASSSRSTWAVSSANGNDDDNMDASLLMSPDYMQPLAPSDLPDLVSHIFNPDKAAWLRHMAVRKFLHWRRTHSDVLSTMTTLVPHTPNLANATPPDDGGAPSAPSSILSSPSDSQVLVSRPHTLRLATAIQQPYYLPTTASPSPFSAARFADHAQREELLAQVRLARWATDLQKSLQNERERFATLQKNEKKGWLLDRWGELHQDGEPGPKPNATTSSDPATAATTSTKSLDMARRHRLTNTDTPPSRRGIDPMDPLGLLDFDDRFRRNGLAVVKVLGGCGVLSAMVVWVLRRWGLTDAFGPAGPSWPHTWFGASSD